MNFVDHYLPYFRQWLVTRPLSALLPFQSLFTESFRGDQLLATPPFSSVLSEFQIPLVCASFQFVVYYSVFFVGGITLLRGLCWFTPEVLGGISCD
jgi:hypothetical protein